RNRSGSSSAGWYSGCARITSSTIASSPPSGSPARYLRQVSKKKSRAWSRVGSNILALFGLAPEFAQVPDQAFRAARLAGEAHIAAVQYQPVVGVAQEFRRNELEQLVFDLARILAGCEPGPVGDTKDVCVDCDRGLAESGVQDDIRRLAADAGQALQRFARSRHLAAMVRDQQA